MIYQKKNKQKRVDSQQKIILLFFIIFRPYLNMEGKSFTQRVRFFNVYLQIEYVQMSAI